MTQENQAKVIISQPAPGPWHSGLPGRRSGSMSVANRPKLDEHRCMEGTGPYIGVAQGPAFERAGMEACLRVPVAYSAQFCAQFLIDRR